MNRQAKRMMQRQKTSPQDRVEAARQRRDVATQRKRTSPSQFLKEVRLELRKVAWPSREELWSYTAVVLVAVVVLTSLVFGLDLFFAKVVLRVFGQGS